jgi:metal-responsive CopG/Arc/MetJ family transcriptional regulator
MTRMVSLRIDAKVLDAVDRAGSAEGRARSDVVREALELWLKRRRLAEQVREHREGYARTPVGHDEFAPVLGAQTWPK